MGLRGGEIYYLDITPRQEGAGGGQRSYLDIGRGGGVGGENKITTKMARKWGMSS